MQQRPITSVMFPTTLSNGQVTNPGHIQLQLSPQETSLAQELLNRSEDQLPEEWKTYTTEERNLLASDCKKGRVALGAAPDRKAPPLDARPDSGHFPDGTHYSITAQKLPLKRISQDTPIPIPAAGQPNKFQIEAHDHGELSEDQLINLLTGVLEYNRQANGSTLHYSVTGPHGAFNEGVTNCSATYEVLSEAAGLPGSGTHSGAGARPQDVVLKTRD
jgi:hypothetical protein